MDQMAPDLKALLGKTQVKELISKRDKPLVSVAHTADVGTVLDVLSQHGILSAPVFVANLEGNIQPSINTLVGFVDVWTVLSAFLQSLPAGSGTNSSEVSAEQLESLGAALCARPVLSLFESNAAVKAAIDSGDVQAACADWEVHDDPSSSVLEVVRSCFLPRTNASSLTSWQSGQGFSLSSSPRVSLSPIANLAAGGNSGSGNNSSNGAAVGGHSRHPAASHRIVVVDPEPEAEHHLAVLSQSDVLRFLAAHHESLRPLGKASLAELGLATGSLHLAAGPACAGASNTGRASSLSANMTSGGGPHNHGGHIPSSPKPPLSGGGYRDTSGLLGSLSGIPASPVSESHFPSISMLQRAGSGPTAMQMSPPASPRVSAGAHHLMAFGSQSHRSAARRQLVAVHESVTALEAFRVLLQQRVSAVAVLAGSGSSANMRLVGNLSASDLRHLKKGGFGRLALSVKQFLASKPVAPDQEIPLAAPRPSAAGSTSGSKVVLKAHAPGVYTCQATASLEELVKMLGAPQHGIHRVYVVDPDQRPAGVVTGTDVLALLSAACSKD